MSDSIASYEQNIEGARLAHGRGDRAGTELALREAIRTAEGLADGHLKLVAALIKLGELKHADGNSDEAEIHFRRALEIGERVLGQDDLALVPPLTSLGALRIARGAPEQAEPLLTRALAISERSLGRDHPDLVVLLNELSRHYLKQSAYGFAEPLLLQLYSIKRSKGEDHPEVATVLATLAGVRQALGRHDAAEQLWRRVLDIRESTLAPNHFATATAIEHLAETCAARGKLGEALQLFQRALSMRELTLGAAHPSLRVSRERIADLQLQGSEETFGLESGLLSGLSQWHLPTTSEFGGAGADTADLPRPGSARMPDVPASPAPVPFTPVVAAPTPIAAQRRAPLAATASAAEPRPFTAPIAAEPAPGSGPSAPVAAPFAAPAAVVAAVRVPEARPPYTPESDARPVAKRVEELHPEYAPEAFAEDDDAPSALRLFAVGNVGQPGGALVMPSFAGDLATIEEELAQQEQDAMFGNRARSVAASAAALVRTRPVPVIAVGISVAALAYFAMGAGATSEPDTFQPAVPATRSALPIAAATITDSAAGSIGSIGALEGSATGRAANVAPTTDRSTAPTPSASEPASRTSSKTSAPERSNVSGPASAPELARPLGGAVSAQLDSAMRAAGGGASSSAGDALTRASVTFTPSLLEKPAAGMTAPKSAQPELIGGMPKIAYPPALRAKGREVQGQVLVEFSVDTLGRPDMSTLSVLQSDHELFTAAVRKAVPSMRFVPGQENGRKVRTLVTKQFRFAIDR